MSVKTFEIHARTEPDPQREEAFAERMVEVLNAGALALMTSIGHRTGLFDTMATMPPATSDEIAARAGLQERYVREWLGAMTVGAIVEHDPASQTYTLPPEHATSLSRHSPGDNVALFAQYIPLLGSVEDDVVHCFHQGGGVPYERYGRFHEIMAEDSGQSVLPALEEHILPLIPACASAWNRASACSTPAAAGAMQSTSWRRCSRPASSAATTFRRRRSTTRTVKRST